MKPLFFDSLSRPLQQLLARHDAYQHLVVPQLPQSPEQRQALALLQQLTPSTLFHLPLRRQDEAECALGGLWLWVDELDRAHNIVQQISSSSGSFWHAITHRREGDFANSKYWYARCADHPVLDLQRAEHAATHASIHAHGTSLRHDPPSVGASLVDLVEDAVASPHPDPRRKMVVELQRREWMLLFDYCAREAVGR